jgi:hypothetical protein
LVAPFALVIFASTQLTRPVATAAYSVIVGETGDQLRGTSPSLSSFDSATGKKTVITSDTGLLISPFGLAVGPSGSVVVGTAGNSMLTGTKGLFTFDIATGTRRVVTTSVSFVNPFGLAVAANGDVIVGDLGNVPFVPQALYRYDVTTGDETTIVSGHLFAGIPFDLAIDQSGNIFVGENGTATAPASLDRFSTSSGAKSVITSGGWLNGLALAIADSRGAVIVGDIGNASIGHPPALLSFEVGTGARRVIASGAGIVVNPFGLAVASDGTIILGDAGNLPFSNQALIRIDPGTGEGQLIVSGSIFVGPFGLAVGRPVGPTELRAASLPSSRSVRVNSPATAFATIVNSGAAAATTCAISPITSLPATFTYQTTNPTTNALMGTPNTPVLIPGGGSQTYVFAFTPTAPFPPTDVQMSFDCTNTNPAPVFSGVNTLLLSASATPTPDIIGLVATLNNDGIVNVPNPAAAALAAVQAGVFAVATVNVGTGAMITVSADTGATNLPVSISICQTTPTTGACQGSPTLSVTTLIGTNATATFGIFVTATANVPFDPAHNRIFVRFKDAGGVTRGSTSVAVRTQ